MIVGLALRSAEIGRNPLWTDEALTLVLAQWPVWDMITKPTDPTPFFYYALHKWFVPEGAGVVGVRSISLVAGVLAMPAMYAIGRMMISREGALLATALLAVAAPLIDYSQEARAYSVLVLLVLLSAAGLLWWFAASQRGGWRRTAALGMFILSTALAFHTHFLAIFWIGPALLILLFFGRKMALQSEREALWSATAVFLLALPEVVRVVKVSVLPGGFDWLQQASPALFIQTLRDSFLPSGWWSAAATRASGITLAVEVLLTLAATAWLVWLVVRVRARLREWAVSNAPAATIIAVLILLPLPIWMFGFVMRPIFLPRTLLLAIPGFILAITLLIELDPQVRRRRITAFLIVPLYLGALLLAGTARPKEPWGGLRQALMERARPGDMVAICPFWKFPAMRHAVGARAAGPLIAPHGEVMFQLDPGSGARAPWQQTYFATVSEPLFRLVTTGVLPPNIVKRTLTEHRPARAWVVLSECEDGNLQAVHGWLGRGKWSRQWIASADLPNHSAIELWRFDADAATDRVVVGLR